MVQGRLEDGVLTLWVKDEFTKSMVGGASHSGGAGAAGLGSERRPGALRGQGGEGRPLPRPAAAPAQAAEHDKLDDLLAFSRQFDNIIIQE